MPLAHEIEQQPRHSEDMQDIITAVPPWILRWGITLFFIILVMFLSLSAFIRYPEIVKTKLKISTPDLAKPIVPKVTGRLTRLLVKNNEQVKRGQPLAYIESTADHKQVLSLLTELRGLQQGLAAGKPVSNSFFDNTYRYNGLGELQGAFQSFIQSSLAYRSAEQSGFLTKKRAYLNKDIDALKQQRTQLVAEREIQQRDAALAEEEYTMHKKLAREKVETPSELRAQESKYLARKSPLLQTEASMVTAYASLLAKEKEILELDNQVTEERAKFTQALNSLISQAEDWQNKYVLLSPEDGQVTLAGNIQQNQMVAPSQEVLYVNIGNEKFYGEMDIPQDNLGKVKQGQQVLVKLRSYRFEEYGLLKGKISYISEVPLKDSVFVSKVALTSNLSDMKRPMKLRQGMVADAEIITEDATLLQRLTNSLVKALNSR